jgi:hypothetical protein
MPVALEFINVLIRRDALDKKIDGGWERFIAGNDLLWKVEWYDDYLLRTGAMNPADVKWIVESYRHLGLTDTIMVDGEEHWADLCVFENLFGSSLPCDWLDYEYWQSDPMQPAIRFLGDTSDVITGRGTDGS